MYASSPSKSFQCSVCHTIMLAQPVNSLCTSEPSRMWNVAFTLMLSPFPVLFLLHPVIAPGECLFAYRFLRPLGHFLIGPCAVFLVFLASAVAADHAVLAILTWWFHLSAHIWEISFPIPIFVFCLLIFYNFTVYNFNPLAKFHTLLIHYNCNIYPVLF